MAIATGFTRYPTRYYRMLAMNIEFCDAGWININQHLGGHHQIPLRDATGCNQEHSIRHYDQKLHPPHHRHRISIIVTDFVATFVAASSSIYLQLRNWVSTPVQGNRRTLRRGIYTRLTLSREYPGNYDPRGKHLEGFERYSHSPSTDSHSLSLSFQSFPSIGN